METMLNDYNNNIKILNKLKREKRNIKKLKKKKKNYMISIIYISQTLLILGGLSWGIVSFFGLYNKKNNGLDWIKTFIMGSFGISSLIMLATKGIKPSFIGDNLLPPTAIQESFPGNYDILYNLKTEPDSIIIFWASKKYKNLVKVKNKAIDDFENSGVTISNNYGIAKIRIQDPGKIITDDIVPRILNKHFYYRILDKKTGILSDIIKEDIDHLFVNDTLNNFTLDKEDFIDKKEIENLITKE